MRRTHASVILVQAEDPLEHPLIGAIEPAVSLGAMGAEEYAHIIGVAVREITSDTPTATAGHSKFPKETPKDSTHHEDRNKDRHEGQGDTRPP